MTASSPHRPTMHPPDPPFLNKYGPFFYDPRGQSRNPEEVRECDLPLIDLAALGPGFEAAEESETRAEIAKAAAEWGFFQVVNHGISRELLEEMRREQVKVFELPFEQKLGCKLLNHSYRWGTPTATCLKEFSWSEAFHIPLLKISEDVSAYGELAGVMEKFAAAMSRLGRVLTGVLAENLDRPMQYFDKNCTESTCFLRLNRYPPCSVSPEVFGLVPHTDSDFLTILYQDQVGGLQLMKDSRWVSVKPNPDALIVNIGDLFQAWSNGVYKSVEHKVMVNAVKERYSIAFFLCPSYDTMIAGSKEPSIYRKFTFGQYRQQVQEDVKKFGHKVGLPRFLL
ncbi:gibberellin 2-beta-dioxygenase 8-like [Aristolochia californica]|uniref:gibberellin 2-beta-dioxygenase 8-like n=1 Tax=Aristolochia californica TaxID=171875 RepID=UPI0035D53B9D